MFSAIKNLFGSSKNVDKIVQTGADGIYNGLDKLIYTDEERADAMAQGREVFLKFVELTYDQNSIRSITRRWLAFLVVAPTMFLTLAGAGVYYFDPAYAGFLFNIVYQLGPWAAGILAFYFGPHIIGAFKSKKED